MEWWILVWPIGGAGALSAAALLEFPLRRVWWGRVLIGGALAGPVALIILFLNLYILWASRGRSHAD